MAQRDWLEVLQIISNEDREYLPNFLTSDEMFLPNPSRPNPFDSTDANFSAAALGKAKPGNWIPVYKNQDVPELFHTKNFFPIRAGQAEFFFYKGGIFFDLPDVDFKKIDVNQIKPIATFIPTTLTANFQRNENAYLNKAVALGYINYFVDGDDLHILKREIQSRSGKRLLYGQFGKIKTTKPLKFKTSKGSKVIKEGFQFEIDLVLENEEEIIIFEAKSGCVPTKSFSLLQLYYPLIYLKSFLNEDKRIRTVFIDVVAGDDVEEYRLMEVEFLDGEFDRVKSVNKYSYCKMM